MNPLLFLAVWLFLILPLRAATVFFTHEGDKPGAARLEIEQSQLGALAPLPLGEGVTEPFKLALSSNAEVLAVAAKKEDTQFLFLVPTGNNSEAHPLPLPAKLSDLVAAPDNAFLLALSKGHLMLVDGPTGEIKAQMNARQQTSPPARKGENFCVLPGGQQVVVSFQKDDDDSPALGNRLLLLGLDQLSIDADLALPRDRPELHIAQSPKEQGPGPELLVAIPEANTLAITLDLYGAVAFTDLDALQRGELKNYQVIPSSEDGQWGTAFPDRVALLPTSAGQRLLVCNAGKDVGIAVFDPASREKVAHFPASAGCDTPVVLPGQPVAVTVVSGKLKSRDDQGVEKTSEPGTTLLVMDFSDPAEPQFTVFDLGQPTLRIAPAGPGQVVVFGKSEALLVEVASGKILDRQETPGPPVRAVFKP